LSVPDYIVRAQTRYRKSPKGRYVADKKNARSRNIDFALTFDEWWELWEKSGKWNLRGNRNGQFRLIRLDPRGSFCKNNVWIAPVQREY
jgi:hypothetical protein